MTLTYSSDVSTNLPNYKSPPKITDFYDLSSLVGCWFLVYKRRIIYKSLNACPLNNIAFAVSGRVWIAYDGLSTPVGRLIVTTNNRP